MLNRKLLAALVLAAASSAALAAPATNAGWFDASAAAQFTEGKGACTANVEGTALQTAETKACDQYYYPNGGY
jgi:hypothetical protein